ncbi:MAG: hypothetical protein M1820_000389 [Bogoriella megaspora]|nr:MAG: hypothetical protein M1820_000389 [Bogoriella megaspora]
MQYEPQSRDVSSSNWYRSSPAEANKQRWTTRSNELQELSQAKDAVPKKRGPKTDVLEALLKRVDGLEKRLHDENKPEGSTTDCEPSVTAETTSPNGFQDAIEGPKSEQAEVTSTSPTQESPALLTPTESLEHSLPNLTDIYVDTYFARVHGKPYHILDEPTIRQRCATNQIPTFLLHSIYAVSARYASEYIGGYNAAVRASREFTARARVEIDIEEPTFEHLQSLLLLALASFQTGKGKKTYMLLSSAISMALALDLHRELPQHFNVPLQERDGRRRLFWSCYLLDRFTSCGSKRPPLISDKAIRLRLPSWRPHANTTVHVEGAFFPTSGNIDSYPGPGIQSQGSSGMLIDIVRILGVAHRYLAAGGVKGDSHFPWHSLSNLSKIRQDLDVWASGTQDVFASIDRLFGQPDSITLVLSKLIYHLIHCLIYRPFLPVDLNELSGTGQHQSWQIEATNRCFLHANAIAELVEIGKSSGLVDWPAFVGYCVCTAGTIHVHGAHYPQRHGEVYSASAEFLAREMQQLTELRYIWAGVQHQRDTLQMVYSCHSELVKSLASNPMRFSPVFHLEDFFDRYPGQYFDGAHVTFADVTVDAVHEGLPHNIDHNGGYGAFRNANVHFAPPHHILPNQHETNGHPSGIRKRRRTTNYLPPMASAQQTPPSDFSSAPPSATLPSQGHPQLPSFTSNQHHQIHVQQQPNPIQEQTTLQRTKSLPVPPQAEDESQMPAPNQTKQQSQPQHQQQCDPPTAYTPVNMSPNFNFSPLPQSMSLTMPSSVQSAPSFDTQAFFPYDQRTPGAASATGSTHTDAEKDPFLTLLERLAENEDSQGGPSELDYFLGGAQG